MGELLTYSCDGSVATITMDDGKVNVLSPAMQAELHAALDRAEADKAVVVLTGRDGIFSAGFDLTVLRGGDRAALDMVRGGFELSERLLSFPTPVVIACTGHAVAAALFLLLSGDYRIGVAGPYKFTANEVAIGLTIPLAAVEICRQRLTPAAFNRVIPLAEPFAPDDAVAAGILDRVVDVADLATATTEVAAGLGALDAAAHAATKLRVRDQALRAIRAAIEAEFPVDA